MRDLTKFAKRLIGAENVKVFGTPGTRRFYMVLWNTYKLSVDSYQRNKFFHATITLKNERGDLFFSMATNEQGYKTRRDDKAEELICYACEEALRLNAPKKAPRKPDRLEL